MKKLMLSLLVLCVLCSSVTFAFADGPAMPSPGAMGGMPGGPQNMSADSETPASPPEGMSAMGFGGWNEQAWKTLQENGVITEETLNAVTEYFTEKTEKSGGFVPGEDGTEPPEKPEGEQNGQNMTPPDGFEGNVNGAEPPEMPEGGMQGRGSQPPEMNGGMQGGQAEQGNQPHEKPEGEQNGQNMTPPEGFGGNGDGAEPPEMPEGAEYMGITTELLDELLENAVITQEIYDAVAAVLPKMTAPQQA